MVEEDTPVVFRMWTAKIFVLVQVCSRQMKSKDTMSGREHILVRHRAGHNTGS